MVKISLAAALATAAFIAVPAHAQDAAAETQDASVTPAAEAVQADPATDTPPAPEAAAEAAQPATIAVQELHPQPAAEPAPQQDDGNALKLDTVEVTTSYRKENIQDVTGSAQAAAQGQNAVAGAQTTLGNWGSLAVSGGTSRGPDGSGWSASLGYSYQGPSWGFQVDHQRSGNWWDLGSTNRYGFHPTEQTRAMVTYTSPESHDVQLRGGFSKLKVNGRESVYAAISGAFGDTVGLEAILPGEAGAADCDAVLAVFRANPPAGYQAGDQPAGGGAAGMLSALGGRAPDAKMPEN